MKLLTLRQVSGFVMIVNTFLPAIVVLTLGLMVWSTAVSTRGDACATVGYFPQAFDNVGYQKKYLAAVNKDDRKKVLKEIAGGRPTAPADKDCSIGEIITDAVFADTVAGIEREVTAIGQKVDRVGAGLRNAIPKITPPEIPRIRPPGVPLLDDAVREINKLGTTVNKGFGALGAEVGKGLSIIGNAVATAFDGLVNPEKDRLYLEMQKIGYKRAVVGELWSGFSERTGNRFSKFFWFFGVLGIWLVLSYVLWVYRRLSVGWALLRNRESA